MAEDDQLMIRIYSKAFKASGFDLKMAMDGDEAIESLKAMNPKPAAILLDVMMPKKNGLEVLKAIKEDQSLKNIPVIILTNLFGKEDEATGFKLGAAAYMVKSQFSPMEIVGKVMELCSDNSQAVKSRE